MEKVNLGTITKPQALKGAFRIKPNILNIKKFKKLKEVYIDNQTYLVESVTLRDTFVIMKVEGIDSCESAESLRNKSIFGDVEIEVSQSFDYLNWAVSLGEKVGKVIDINNYGSKDILTIQFDKNCMVPVIDGLIKGADSASKTITLDNEIFEQVAVYEN